MTLAYLSDFHFWMRLRLGCCFHHHRSRKRRIWLLHSWRWPSARPHPHRGNSMKHLWNTKKREVQLLEGLSQGSLCFNIFNLSQVYVKPAFEFTWDPVVHNSARRFSRLWTSLPRHIWHAEDELVFEQGERGKQFFLLVEGEVSVSWCEGSRLRKEKQMKIYESDACFSKVQPLMFTDVRVISGPSLNSLT